MIASHERRGAKRFPLELCGYAIINGDAVQLRTHDISQGGSLLQIDMDVPLEIGSNLLVRLDVPMKGKAVICRVIANGQYILYGVRFDRFDFHSDLILLAYLVRHGQ